MTTIFGKIVRGEIPCDKVYEDERCLAFNDVNPTAPVHVLVISKTELRNLNAVDDSHAELLGHLLVVARKVAELKGISQSGYRVVANTEAGAGQSVFHLHLHVIGGRALDWPPG